MRIAPLLIVALGLTACADTKPPQAPAKKLTGRQQDSAARAYHHELGQSGIPGVSAINKAQKAADAESKRVNAMDTIH